jgi:hypothetical protein
MAVQYRYEIDGTGANDQTWACTGHVTIDRPAEFAGVPDIAMRSAFMELTEGKAVYGEPGKGCVGPYEVTRMLIERMP